MNTMAAMSHSEDRPTADEVEPVGAGLFARREAELLYTDERTGHRVLVEFKLTGRRYELRHVSVRSDEGQVPIDSETLRRLSIQQLRERLAGREPIRSLFQKSGDSLHSMRELPHPQLMLKGRPGPTDERLLALAEIYTAAYVFGLDATNESAAYFGLTRPTCGRWVMKAREREYLPAAG